MKNKTTDTQTKPFYLTTTLPYVNSDPHIGFALEIIRADMVVRYQKLMGREVFFNTGTDEHGIKIYRKAQETGKTPQEYVDGYADKFKKLLPALGILPEINFIRTTDDHHVAAAQEFWKVCDKNGDIYKKNYKVKYCVGCELQKTDSELVDGHCPIHPKLELEIIEEENYFFRFSKYQDKLLELYKSNPKLVIPETRLNEIRAFVERGLEDFSISRLSKEMPWGVPVPDDDSQVMYVWFDALVNYVSAVGWPNDSEKYEKWLSESGGMVQYCGKDNLRQQSAMWQAMLMSAGLPASKNIIIDGFINVDGQKMSKSLGNVVDPIAVVEEYGHDALRYYVAREFHPFEDSDFTHDKFKTAYNAHLANGLGNLVSRVMKMASQNLEGAVEISEEIFPDEYNEAFKAFDMQKVSNFVWGKVAQLDLQIQETEPFKLVKTDKEGAVKIIRELVEKLGQISRMLEPILPDTAQKIQSLIKNNRPPETPIFPRKD